MTWIQVGLLLFSGGYLYVDEHGAFDEFGTVFGIIFIAVALGMAGLVVGVMLRRDGARISLIAVEVLALGMGLAVILVGDATVSTCTGPIISAAVILCLVESVTRRWFQSRR